MGPDQGSCMGGVKQGLRIAGWEGRMGGGERFESMTRPYAARCEAKRILGGHVSREAELVNQRRRLLLHREHEEDGGYRCHFSKVFRRWCSRR